MSDDDEVLASVEGAVARLLAQYQGADDAEIATLLRDDMINQRVKDQRYHQLATADTVGRVRRTMLRGGYGHQPSLALPVQSAAPAGPAKRAQFVAERMGMALAALLLVGLLVGMIAQFPPSPASEREAAQSSLSRAQSEERGAQAVHAALLSRYQHERKETRYDELVADERLALVELERRRLVVGPGNFGPLDDKGLADRMAALAAEERAKTRAAQLHRQVQTASATLSEWSREVESARATSSSAQQRREEAEARVQRMELYPNWTGYLGDCLLVLGAAILVWAICVVPVWGSYRFIKYLVRRSATAR